MEQILIVEDDISLAKGLCRALESSEIRAENCGTLEEAGRRLEEWHRENDRLPLLLLDVNLPDGSGLDFLKKVKESYDIPVIMLTANDMEMDIVAGLEQGAEDYITKPFSLAILRARVAAALRRRREVDAGKGSRGMRGEAGGPGTETLADQPADKPGKVCPGTSGSADAGSGGKSGERVVFGQYDFDFVKMLFRVNGRAVELSKTEQKLLRYFVVNRGITLGRSMLIDRVWSDGAEYVDENALSVAVNRLRDKLSARPYIKTVYGVGYIWVKE